jgi:hypothetical protein
MSNKRVSELNEKTVPADADLFLITDVTAVESRKITAVNIKNYVTGNNNFTGSLNGTASYALQALSASFAPTAPTASYAISTSFALTSVTSTSASYSRTSSFSNFAVSCSYAATSSISFTSSVQQVVSASNASFAQTASYLLFVNGFNNGTSSMAITASFSQLANNASNLLYTGQPNGTASYALRTAVADTSSISTAANFLNYNSSTPNGTASFAVSSSITQFAQIIQKPMLAGMFVPSISSSSELDLLTMSIQRTDGNINAFTYLTVVGSVTIFYTSSAYVSMSLVAFNQDSLISYNYDLCTMGHAASGGSTGSVTIPFTMMGTQNLTSGSYWVYVTASNGPSRMSFDFNRTPTFRIESEADIVTVV